MSSCKEVLFNYPGGVGRDVDCAPDSVGNRRNPAGQDAAWGRSGRECTHKIEEGIKKEEEHCADVAAYWYFSKWHVGNDTQLRARRWRKKLRHRSVCIF